MKKCKKCKWFSIMTTGLFSSSKEGFSSYGQCHLLSSIGRKIRFICEGKEKYGAYLVHESFGCIGFEKK